MAWSRCSWHLWRSCPWTSIRKEGHPSWEHIPRQFPALLRTDGFLAGTRVFGGMYVTVVPWKYIELENDMRIDLWPSRTRPKWWKILPHGHTKKGTAMPYIHPSVVKQSFRYWTWWALEKRVSFQLYEFFWVSNRCEFPEKASQPNRSPPKKTLHNTRKRYSTSPKMNGWNLQIHLYI